MKWVILVIIVSLAAYTYLTLHYRKANPAYLAYQDTKDRAGVMRLLSAGFQRVVLTAQRPADPSARIHLGSPANTEPATGGLDPALASSLLDLPLLPAEITRVSAAASVSALLAYPIQFTCTLADNKSQLSGAELYVKDDILTLIPTFEQLDGGLLARTRESVVSVIVPAGALKPRTYRVTLIGARASRTWTLQVH
jgi:hypothetical protein